MKKNYENERPSISSEIRRKIETDAGHKCTIKECNEHTYLEIHHIDLNRENNSLENLILLCDKHHKMAHKEVIDRKSLKIYKDILNLNNLLSQKVEELENNLKDIRFTFDKKTNWEYSLMFEIATLKDEFEYQDLHINVVYNSNPRISIYNVYIEKIENNLFKVCLDTETRKMGYEVIKKLQQKFEIFNIRYKE
ncbi:HNH endonuclease signature motif containing protein [Flavobacterium sp. UBA7663]|uniref:HNH endonuclease signature motif containing protein n=1 Tax=Flavobacterium sp. UBA7663 TaxID=1946557 RepID=UPI0025BBFBF0|nr:HNH endonuclease signature motif containing protein [Flavobacterium sp. UBA7663]